MGHPFRLNRLSWELVLFVVMLITSASCASAPALPDRGTGGTAGGTATGTPTATLTSTPSATPSPIRTSTPTWTPTETETATPVPQTGGPYVVEQTETLGGEKISGVACDLANPFDVTSAAPAITFVFRFFPAASDHGQVTYAYSIPSAGESHNATGSYSIQPIKGSNKLHLSLKVSDHVVFHGFDGNIPLRYEFNLAPIGGTPCP